jgi:hypothetical protein
MRELLRIMRAKEILKNRNRDTYLQFGIKQKRAFPSNAVGHVQRIRRGHFAFTWSSKGV